MLTETLANKEWETSLSTFKLLLYSLERNVGSLLFRRSPKVKGQCRLLNLGCGPLYYSGWCNADEFAFKRMLREKSFRPDWRLDITRNWRCLDNFWDGIFTQHVIEHVTYSEAVFVFRECLRTLKPGAWLRVIVPSLDRYANFCVKGADEPEFARFPQKALGVSFLTQMHFHKSVWDAGLMSCVLSEIGFSSVKEVEFNTGTDNRLLRDQSDKHWESLYFEAQKPF